MAQKSISKVKHFMIAFHKNGSPCCIVHWYAEKFTLGMRCNAILVALEVDQLQRELYLTTHHEEQRDYFETYFLKTIR